MIINRCTHTQSLIHVWLFTAPQTGPPGSSVHRIFQSRMQEWVAISYSRGSFQPRDQHRLLHFLHCTWILYHCATWEAHQWMKALQMVFIIYAVLNFPNLLQLLHIGLVTKKIQNVYNIALTLVTTVSKIMLTLIVLLFSVQSLSCVRLFVTPWIAAHQASLSITNSQSLLKLMSMKLVMSSSHFRLCRPLLLLPPIPPSIRVFSNESTLLMRWPKYWSFSFSISPSKEHPGLISFMMDWLDLLAVQGTLKSLLQHHSSKA